MNSLSPDSKLRVLFTGPNKAGSWKIRGEQISSMRPNWSHNNKPTANDIAHFDIFCFVKRVDFDFLAQVKKQKKLCVFDIVDSWAQPDEGIEFDTLEKAKNLFKDKWSKIQADGYIFPNQTMWKDFQAAVPFGAPIYHHYYPKLTPIKINEVAKVAVYEGGEQFLGDWKESIQKICYKYGIEFRINPENYLEADLGIAFRSGPHDSFLANRYKSNVKLANFYGAGMPCLVSHKERSYHEVDNGFVRFFRDLESFEESLKQMLRFDLRQEIHQAFLKSRENFNIEKIADEFELFFSELHYRGKAGILT